MKKRLIVGLGNVGLAYSETRHNIGFKVIESLARKHHASFEANHFGHTTRLVIKGRRLLLLQPDTLMNLSGRAVKYWLQKEKISLDQLLIITDDIHLPFGTFRIRPKGSDGGHNGLRSIQEQLQATQYPRLRFGVGGEYSRGEQVDHVLGIWTDEEYKHLPSLIEKSAEAVEQFSLSGLGETMTQYNGSHLPRQPS